MKRFYFVSLICCFLSFIAEAKVFSTKSERFGPYIIATYSPSKVKNTLLSESNSTAAVPVTIDTDYKSNMSGELGFVTAGDKFNFRFGFEVIRPPTLTDAEAQDASGNPLYKVTSEATVYAPKISVEYNVRTWSSSRLMLAVGFGAANLVGRNSYVFTPQGVSTYGLADFSEDLRSSGTLLDGALAFESLLMDTNTFYVNVGYRQLKFASIKQNKEIANFQSAAIAKGDPATNTDATARTLNFSNYYIGLGIRIWLF